MMKQLKVTVNGKVYDIVIEETGSVAAPAPRAAAPAPAPVVAAAPAPVAAPAPAPVAAPAPAGGSTITAPMSGTVTKHKVKVGDAVKHGDVIVILEAMKMENDLVSPADGTITEIRVSEGTAVKPGEIIAVIA
jgi:glutaconyl-CoA decarboxylase